MRPQVFNYKPKRTVWIDYKTGRGLTDAGESVRPKIGDRRKNPNLADMLDTAHALGAERIMLTGAVPDGDPGKSHWLIVRTPGWTPGGHWLTKPVTGRFTHEATGAALEVRTVEEWFGTNDMTPATARDAWSVVSAALAAAVPGAAMGLTPAATGANAWALSLPKTLGRDKRPFELEQLPKDLAEELHATSGQHRMEHLVSGPDRCDCGACVALFDAEATPKLDQFVSVDGRFMYAAMCRELGTGGARRLNRATSAELLDGDPFARARFYVRVTVPDVWEHVGLLAAQHADPADGWHYPNRPGTRFETWADGAEIKIARDAGWGVEPVEGVVFAKSRPLDTWAERLTRARHQVNENLELDGPVRRAAAAALRQMLIATIGNFASRIKERTITVWSATDIPGEYADTVTRYGEAYTYKVPGRPHDARTLPFYRPELAAQVWARARARVLVGKTATGYTTPMGEPARLAPSGVLALDPATVIGINGDAVYSSTVPAWALPVGANGFGGDDGAVGRLRVKGILENVATPRTIAERNALREQAEAAGTPWGADL